MSAHVTVIKPRTTIAWFDLGELWAHRDLLVAFALRDVSVRYKQTFMGVAWAIIQPAVTTLVYTITFGRFAGMPSDGVPYPIFSFTGLAFWMLFSASLTAAAESLVQNEGILKKVYFPRLITPLSSGLVCLIDFGFSLLCMAAMLAYFHIVPSLLGILLIPVLALWTLLASVGLGLFLAALNAKFRDVRYALPFFVQLLIFVSPVIYPAKMFRNHAWILALNPMTGVIETARYVLLGAGTVSMPIVATSLTTSVVFLLGGFLYFQDMEKTLADIL